MLLDEKIATRQSYGEALAELGEENKNVVVLDADLSGATKTSIFAKEFPERFFDMGIAEQDMMGTGAGLSTFGKIPYVSTFAVFAAGRAYDQIRNTIAHTNANVKICATHAGITVGEDGATHQMLEDISMMRTLPNMIVMSPSDDVQTKWAIKEIANVNGPVYVRLSRLATPVIYDEGFVKENNIKFEIGKAIQLGDGTDASIIATGVTVSEALKAQEVLKEKGINVRVIDVHTIKPLDKEMIIKCAKETKRIITIEDHSIIGGLGTAVCEVLSENFPAKVTRIGINNTFGESGKAEELLKKAVDMVKKKGFAKLGIRSFAEYAGISTQPIYDAFCNLKQFNEAVILSINDLYEDFLKTEILKSNYPPYKASGLAYVNFARREPELFKALFMRSRKGESGKREDESFNKIAESISKAYGISYETARKFHLEMWLIVHGFATQIATEYLTLPEEDVSDILTDSFNAFMKLYKGK